MSKIFISYRRNDTKYVAKKIFKDLAYFFGEHNLFLDVDSIPPGVDFQTFIEKSVKECNILLAIIGSNWISSSEKEFKNKLFNPNDFVRIELEIAIQEKIPIIPILIDYAKFPSKEDLPNPLHPLTNKNAFPIRSNDLFTNDIKKISKILKKEFDIPYNNHGQRLIDNSIAIYKNTIKIKFIFYGLLILWIFGVAESAYYINKKEESKQKIKSIIAQNTRGELNNEQFIKSFYDIVKVADLTESYSMLSKNAQNKLPMSDYGNWWSKTVLSVKLKRIKNMSDNNFLVKLIYHKVDDSEQCSEDIVKLVRQENKWFIDDFTWGSCKSEN